MESNPSTIPSIPIHHQPRKRGIYSAYPGYDDVPHKAQIYSGPNRRQSEKNITLLNTDNIKRL